MLDVHERPVSLQNFIAFVLSFIAFASFLMFCNEYTRCDNGNHSPPDAPPVLATQPMEIRPVLTMNTKVNSIEAIKSSSIDASPVDVSSLRRSRPYTCDYASKPAVPCWCLPDGTLVVVGGCKNREEYLKSVKKFGSPRTSIRVQADG